MKRNHLITIAFFVYQLSTSLVIAQISGNVTINSNLPTSGTNYQSFTALAAQIKGSGVSGTLTVDVVANSGPYNEQPVFNQARVYRPLILF